MKNTSDWNLGYSFHAQGLHYGLPCVETFSIQSPEWEDTPKKEWPEHHQTHSLGSQLKAPKERAESYQWEKAPRKYFHEKSTQHEFPLWEEQSGSLPT